MCQLRRKACRLHLKNKVLLCCLLLLSCTPVQAKTIVAVTGIEGNLKTNVELVAGKAPDAENARKYQRYKDALPDLALDALSALGYYGADITVTESSSGADTTITIAVKPGDPVVIDTLDISVTGDGSEDPAYRTVLRELPIVKGAIFVSGNYEATKAALLDRAQDLGYFDFAFSESEVRVSRKQLSAKIKLTADTGERYTYGPILFEQKAFTASFLERWLPFEEGDPYESGLIGELTQNLQNSGYFKSVRVQPQQDRRYGKTIPVKVDLTPKDANQVAIGLGFQSDTGIRTKLTWGKPLLNRRGHSADAALSLSKVEQSASFSYRIPRRKQPLYNYWGIDFGIKNADIKDTKSLGSTLNFQRVSRTPSMWTESLFIRWERERSTAGNAKEQTSDLLLPGVSYSRSRSKGSPFPVWGQATSFLILGGSSRALSTIDFLKTLGTFRYLRALSERHTLIGAVQYGAIHSNDYDRVPISQRFFAGGDRSVRGFRYRDLSPRDVDDKAVGGRYLEVLSAEYNYRFLDRWSGALFVDAGRAFNKFSASYSVGAGFGVRWQSPVGPFRIDIATPVSDDDDGGVRIHLSLGSDL